ncbi:MULTISPECIES: choice-of-anchor J domain-containing protein [Flavobacteriaceae]|jgi:hypothetical protein|uniref:Choice-of-anchor J domain-containing protein n=2 Tax=Flavobacteriaceae TaxID=49546 RepID=A0ABN1JFW9_9FLAO|nr:MULTISPECIES: choice-of-anchor J domain-containing protein [Meridianimaribacter]TBV28099.1 hypothetical protein DMZ43_03390 [Meridianimaribacter sp. CL38]TDY13780.1 hypothetical protein A8975_0376 [Meridianimaribacter flavus]
MKRIVYLLTIVGIIFVGCNPMEDINNEIDAIDNPVVGNAEYTLTDDDYEDLELGFGSFDSEDQARELLPDFLAGLYPFWGDGSSVVVGYNLYVGNAEGVSDFTGADIYEFTNSDYATTGSDAFGFYPNVNATNEIPAILDAQIASPTEGQIVLAKYDQYTETPEVGLADLVAYNFAGSMEGWTVAEESGADDVWTSQSGYVQGNGYFGTQIANEEWLVSPSIDLSGESDLKFQITQELDFAGDTSLIKILVSTDYTDDVLTATWDEITLANPATGDMASSEDYDFSAYDGETINVAFRYESTDSDAARWRIASLKIKTLGATGDTNSKGEYFMYSGGTWVAVEGVYYLSSDDFDAMGEGSGQPGQYDNFSSSVSPNNYLPAFMEITFPYGQEDEEMFIIYDYFSSSTGAQIRGNLYTVTDGVWTGHESTIETTLQFGHDGTEWLPDNTIQYTLTGTDYSYVATNYAEVEGFEAAAGNLASFGNFNRTGGGTSWSDEMMFTVLTDLLANVIAPTAEEGQKYVLSYDVYVGSGAVESLSLIKEGGEWILNE